MRRTKRRYTITKDSKNQDIDEERIKSIVKASEVVKDNLNTNTENTDCKEESSDENSDSIFQDLKNQLPEYEEYSATAKIVDIRFNEEFEKALLTKSTRELKKLEHNPEWVNICFKTDDDEWTENFSFESDKEQKRTDKFIGRVGDGRIDNLIGRTVTIKPDYEGNNRYKAMMPARDFTSLLKLKITEYRSRIYKRKSNKSDTYTKYMFVNLLQLLCSLTVIGLFIFLSYTVYLSISSPDIRHSSVFMYLVFAVIFYSFVVVIILTFSRNIRLYYTDKKRTKNSILGDFELFLIAMFIKSYNITKSRLQSLNEKIGQLLTS